MTFGLPWSFSCRGKLKQQLFRFKPRKIGCQGQLRTDQGGEDDDPPYDLCNNALWRWVEKQSKALEELNRKCLVIF